MPRDLSSLGRHAPVPRHHPFVFYSCARLGDPEMLTKIMEVDPYFITQDNGAGAPIHFATTYAQLDMVHYLVNMGASVNQRDNKGMTPLHRAAFLAHVNGYLEIYEYFLSRGADPSIKMDAMDEYLDPGHKLPVEVARKDMRENILELEEKYKDVPRQPVPHKDIGDWWTLYDFGLEEVKSWAPGHDPRYPEVVLEDKIKAEKDSRRQDKRAARAALAEKLRNRATAAPSTATPNGASAAAEPVSGAEIEAQTTQGGPIKNTPVAFLFPGQGSQAVGMLGKTKDVPAVAAMLEKAKDILGYDLLRVCEEGPKADLDDTARAQPALLVAGLAALEKLRQDNPALIDECSACAGLSLGEYTALVFSGALSFEDALKVVKVRAESMAEAASQGEPHGMLSIVGLDDAKVEEICAQVRTTLGDGVVCQVANKLFPQGRVVSGHKNALDEAQKLATDAGALKAMPLAVSGAFHTSLMEPARQRLAAVLETIQVNEPRIPVWSNVTARPIESAAAIRDMLAKQLVSPVEWEATLKALVHEEGKNKLVELGPGQQIKAMSKRIDLATWKAFTNISS